MFILNILQVNKKKLHESDWIINGKSLHEHCKRLRYVEKADTVIGYKTNFRSHALVIKSFI